LSSFVKRLAARILPVEARETKPKQSADYSSLVFGFEQPMRDLELMPIAARRALDTAGLRLSLEAWRTLSIAARSALVESGSAPRVPVPEVEGLLGALEPPPERIAPQADPAEIPPDLAAELGSLSKELRLRWPALSGLERYALVKLARPGHLDAGARKARLATAFQEIVQPKGDGLSHLTASGDAHMVNVSDKPPTARLAVAEAFVSMKPETLALLAGGTTPKGDVLATARIAGIQAAKRTPELIPLCHAIALTGVEVELELRSEPPGVAVKASARAFDRTGVEMEAMVAASVASLTLYDMLKAVDRGMSVRNVVLSHKSGGRSGDYRRGPDGDG
jgi:molybdenum cofactor biosynthesis protein MoaC